MTVERNAGRFSLGACGGKLVVEAELLRVAKPWRSALWYFCEISMTKHLLSIDVYKSAGPRMFRTAPLGASEPSIVGL